MCLLLPIFGSEGMSSSKSKDIVVSAVGSAVGEPVGFVAWVLTESGIVLVGNVKI